MHEISVKSVLSAKIGMNPYRGWIPTHRRSRNFALFPRRPGDRYRPPFFLMNEFEDKQEGEQMSMTDLLS